VQKGLREDITGRAAGISRFLALKRSTVGVLVIGLLQAMDNLLSALYSAGFSSVSSSDSAGAQGIW